NEVVQLITCAERKSLRHRLNALAIARTDQARHVERTHPSPRLVTQTIHKRLEPTSKRVSPIQCPASHGRPLQESRPPMSHRKSDLGILRRSKSAKVVLATRQGTLWEFNARFQFLRQKQPGLNYGRIHGKLKAEIARRLAESGGLPDLAGI